MALYIEAGFDLAVLGTASVSITESLGGGAATATVASATYCHTDLTSVLGSGNYDDFATALKTALDAASPNALTYTVTWVRASGEYEIEPSSGTVALAFASLGTAGTLMRRILGFNADLGTTSLATSNVTPYYYIDPANACKSNVSDDYEPDDIVEAAISDGGTQYAVHRTTAPVFSDFDVTSEARAAIFTRAAPDGTTAADVPWTYQHLWQHARGRYPLLVTDDNESTVCHLRAEGGSFKPTRMVSDWDGRWMVSFPTIVTGRL